MAMGQMQVDGGVFEFGVSQQDLDRPQVRSGLEHVRRVGMPQNMRSSSRRNARTLCGLPTGIPGCFGADRNVRAKVVGGAGEQPCLRLHPAPVFTQWVSSSFSLSGTSRSRPPLP